MKTIFTLLLTVSLAAGILAEDKPSVEGLTRLAVLPLSGTGVEAGDAVAAAEQVRADLSASGMYYVLNGEEMKKRAEGDFKSMAAECFTEKCALEAGEMLAVSKVVTGELAMEQSLYVLKLKMFNLENRMFEARVMVASDCPKDKIKELATAAVAKLRGMAPPSGLSITVVPYKGRAVNHKLEWSIMAGVTVAAAFIWGSGSGALSPEGELNEDLEVSEYDMSNPAYQRGAFGNMAFNARPHGMGGAFVALSDDANAMAYNPAGMVRAAGREVTAGYLNLPFEYGSYPYFYTGYFNKITRTMSHGQALVTSSSPAFGSTETQVITGFAKLFDDIRENWRPFSVGANVKFLMFTAKKATDDVYAWQENAVEGGGFGASVDLGAQFELTERITAGLLLKDIVSSVSYTNTTTGYKYSEGVPANLVIGGHYRLFNNMNLVLDGNKSLYQDVPDNVRLGGEMWLWNVLAVRLGMSQNFAMDAHRKGHFGTGLKWDFKRLKQRIGVDYSYEYFPLSDADYMDLSGSQRFALNYSF